MNVFGIPKVNLIKQGNINDWVIWFTWIMLKIRQGVKTQTVGVALRNLQPITKKSKKAKRCLYRNKGTQKPSLSRML